MQTVCYDCPEGHFQFWVFGSYRACMCAHVQVRERVAANVDAILNSEGALNELRPGPWMLDAADDPVGLPNEQAAQANTDHLLRARAPCPPSVTDPQSRVCACARAQQQGGIHGVHRELASTLGTPTSWDNIPRRWGYSP